MALETTTNSLIVVIRSHAGRTDDGPSNWHGSVKHAQSRERMHFIEYAHLGEFIAAHSQAPLLDPWRTRLVKIARTTLDE
jgi:hypothetical protein